MERSSNFNFEHAVENNNKRAIKAGAVATLTLDQFETAYDYFDGKCAYSGQEFLPNSDVSIEHIIPIISGGHSMAFNCIPVNGKYNSSKSGYHLLDWWKCQTDSFGNTVYNPYRLLKILNYMIKSLEAIEKENFREYVLMDNEVDKFLNENTNKISTNNKNKASKNDYKRISQIEIFAKMDMLSIEDLYSVYSELDNLKLNTAIFFEETIYELKNSLPSNIIEIIHSKINALPKIYIDNKKVFNNDMDEIDINIRKNVLEWTEIEEIENKYGIIGYMDFEVLKEQKDIKSFLDDRKNIILSSMGAAEHDFNNIVNKVPNILTDLNVQNRLDTLSKVFNISCERNNEKSSELSKFIINKPDLLLSGETMEILLKYASTLPIDKRLLRKGIPISTIIDNIETAIEITDTALLDVDEKVKRRVFDKLINNSTGNLLRSAYRNFKGIVKSGNENLSKEEIARDAARWIICISEKYNTAELLKPKRIDKTRNLYQNMKFNEEGHLIGVNPNAYIVPQIIASANLNISREAENELVNNVFFAKPIKQQGQRADKLVRELGAIIKKNNPEYSEEKVIKEASRWFVFLSECSDVPLGELFLEKNKARYIETTYKYYKKMQFDSKGNFIDVNIPELKDLVIGVDYKQIVDSFFKSTGNFYIVKGKYIPKSEIQNMIYEEISKCKNKRAVKSTCIRILKGLTQKIKKEGDRNNGNDR